MRELRLKPRVQIWVCVNERSADELTSCRRQRGEEIIAALQAAALRLVPDRLKGDVWINRSLCQGSCTAHGVSIVIEGKGSDAKASSRRFAAAVPEDADGIMTAALLALSEDSRPIS